MSGKLQGNVREIQKPLAVVTMILKPPLPTVNIKIESPTSFYSLRRRPNVTPVSNVCEAATNPCVGFPTDSTNYRKCVSNFPQPDWQINNGFFKGPIIARNQILVEKLINNS